MKINISQSAKDEFRSVKDTNRAEELIVRVFVKGYGWGGPTFGITLDELKENDYHETFEEGKIVIEKDLLDIYGGFDVDYQKNWFSKGFYVRSTGVKSSRC